MPSVSVLPPDPVTQPAAAAGVSREPGLFPGFSRPVRVDVAAPPSPSVGLARIAAIVPCHNRREDAAALLADLASLDRAGIDLRIILVDNASTTPLSDLIAPGLPLEHLRLNTNTGGSGGFSAGLSLALSLDERTAERDWRAFDPEFIWLVDSDARIPAGTLQTLLHILRSDHRIIAAGPAIADPQTGRPFELGGRINSRNGTFEPMVPGSAGVTDVGCAMSDVGCKNTKAIAFTSDIAHPTSHIPVQYLAACCALVRADAARAAGPFPDTFLNGDDVEWFLRMAQRTGGRIVATPSCLAFHPRFDRFPTWTRYYTTRNAHVPLAAINAPRSTRFRRAMLDVFRAAQQQMTGRSDLARLHLLGLQHAAIGRTTGIAPPDVIAQQPALKPADLIAALRERLGSLSGLRVAVHPSLGISTDEREALLDAFRVAECDITPLATRGGLRSLSLAAKRWLGLARADIALVPARGRPDTWFAARTLVQVAPGARWIQSPGRVVSPIRATWSLALGTTRALRIARRPGTGPTPLDTSFAAAGAITRGPGRALSVEAIVLSHNRWPALHSTIERLLASPSFDGRASDPGVPRTITIVDNHSTDGTPDRVEAFLAPRGVNLIRLGANLGVDAFNTAVARSTADAVLILDDDASPDDHALVLAIDELAARSSLGAVTLHPRHPRGGQSEWPGMPPARPSLWTGNRCDVATSTDRWPIMGCANLVRRTAWTRVGGYEPAFFLYRNDADLALKLLAAGLGVHFNPALVVWHDSPTGPGARKSVRWHELATRNWIWMAKRHRGMGILPMCLGSCGALLGYLWAHKLAGLSASRHLATLRGGWTGLTQPAPPLGSITPDGRPWRSLMNLRLGRSEK
jgi:GT2 family glycosyltransferase